MRQLFRIAAGAVVVAGLGAAGLFGTEYLLSRPGNAGQSAGNAGGGGGGGRAARVGVAQPERREIETAVTAVGTIMPSRAVEVTPAVSGRVVAVPVTSGAKVAQGDTLVALDAEAEEAALAGAEASRDEARQNLSRVEQLAQANTAAEQRLEQARAAFARAEAEVMAAWAALDDRKVTAPFAGTLGLIDVDPGAYVSAANPLTMLSDLSVVQVDMALPERYFSRVAPGQRVSLTVPAYPDASFEGLVTVRDSAVSPGSRSFDVRAEIDNSDRRLVGGMFAEARLVFDSYDGLAVPDDAIVSEGPDTFVYVVADGQARRRDVALGGSVGSLTEITEGLEPEARVVVAGWDNLRDGAPVEVAEDMAREGLE